jgi:hypothetical protein
MKSQSKINGNSTALTAGFIAAVSLAASGVAGASTPFLPAEHTVSTVAANGDVNPYGVAFVPKDFSGGMLKPGDILVSNFNNSMNVQGTGTSIVRVPANGGPVSTFFTVPGTTASAMGLTAAEAVLSGGKIIVGYLPVPGGTFATAAPGGLLILDKKGNLLFNIAGGGQVAGSKLSQNLQGPWGMAVKDNGAKGAVVYISNVLSGTVIRSEISFNGGQFQHSTTVIAAGLDHENDANGFLLGPSGLAYDASRDILYIANSKDNTVSEIKDASTVTQPSPVVVIFNNMQDLHGPLDLALAPNGDLLVANSDGSNVNPASPSEIVEFTRNGEFIREFNVDASNGGAFGLAVEPHGDNESALAYVNDNGGGGAVPTLTTVTLAN